MSRSAVRVYLHKNVFKFRFLGGEFPPNDPTFLILLNNNHRMMLDLVSKLVNLLLKEHPKNIHINALSIISINSELILHSIQDTA